MPLPSTINIETATRILTLLSVNPGLTKTAIFQKLSLIPIKGNAYIIFFVKEGIIELLDGKYTITETGKKYISEIHTEQIICPECGEIQTAEVKHTIPFYTYIHECKCGEIITESTWEKVTDKTVMDTLIIVTSRYAEMKTKLHNLIIKIKTI